MLEKHNQGGLEDSELIWVERCVRLLVLWNREKFEVTSLRTSLAAAERKLVEEARVHDETFRAQVRRADRAEARETQLVEALEPFAIVAKRWIANEITQGEAQAGIAHYERALEVYEQAALRK